MFKLLLLVLFVAGIYLLLKKSSKSLKNNSQQPKELSEDMVRCSHCGVHLPKSESITTQGQFFCSDAHRREYK